MTAQNGQGDTPRVGVVLPSGGDRPVGEDRDRTADRAPAAGQPWGTPWGPESAPAPAGGTDPQPGYGYPQPPAPEPPATQPPAAQPPAAPLLSVPLPPAGPPPSAPAPPQQQAPTAQPLPPSAPAAPYGTGAAPAVYEPAHQLPGALPQSAPPPTAPQPPQAPPPQPPAPYGSAPPQQPNEPWNAAPQPPAADADATQFLPPQPDPGSDPGLGPAVGQAVGQAEDLDATQYIPPQGVGELDATQHIPPYSEAPQAPAAPQGAQAPPIPEEPGRAPYGIRPGAPGDRQPPAEFDNLFRPEGGGASRAGDGRDSGTQPLPIFENAVVTQTGARGPRKQGPGEPPQGPRGRRAAAPAAGHGVGAGGGRRRPLLIGAGGLALLVVAGLVGGAALSGNDKKDEKAAPAESVEEGKAQEPSPEPTEEEPDPVETQAKELDKLLADSNNSRDSVIRSVENIKKCEELPTAAAELKAAAQQRKSLVQRLDKLTVDQIPQHQQLTAQLRRAWKASESADNHYAAWANEVKRPRNCKDGAARSTPQLAKANAASGVATKAKQEAAKLWNPTARTYKLPERQPTQL